MDTAVKGYVIPAILVIVVASAAYLIWADNQSPPETEDVIPFGVTTGYRAKNVDLFDLNGQAIRFSDYRGEILIIDFMAPWCNPCKEQIKVLREVEEIPGVSILSINVDPDYNITYLNKLKERERMSWPLSSSPEAAIEYKVTGIPLILLVDKEGVIRYRGYFTTLTHFEQLIRNYG